MDGTTRRIVGVALFAQLYFVIGFVSFGFPELIKLRLQVDFLSLPWHVGAFLLCGVGAAIWAERRIAQGITPQQMLNVLGWCGGIQAATALLALGIRSPIDIAALVPALGITLGLASAFVPATIGQVVGTQSRAYVLGPAIGLCLLLLHVAPITFVRCERLIAMTGLIAAIAGWHVWTRRHEITIDAGATDRDLLNITAANAAALAAFLAAALFQVVAHSEPARDALWTSSLAFQSLGVLQLVVCWAGVHLMRRRFVSALAIACLVSAAAALATGESGEFPLGAAYSTLYALGSAAGIVLIAHRLSERRPKFALIWICWIAIPLGTFAGITAASGASFILP